MSSMSGMVGTLCALVLASTPCLALARVNAAPADSASTNADAEALSEKAVEAFSAKRYDESIGLFEQAYGLNANPNYLFNIGRVYEEKGDLEQAVAHYQKFVSQPGVDLQSREAATERLKVLRGALQQLEEENEGQDEGQNDEGDDTPPPEETSLEAAGENSDSEDDRGPTEKKRGQRIAGYTLLGVGGAGLIVGGVLGGLAQSNADDADAAEFVDDALRMRDDARRQARAADAMFITGGVLAAAGLVLVLTTLGKGKPASTAGVPPRRWVIAPAASPRSAGAAVHGRF
ncbi:MAG: tetratricopeptide repeat protein [Nannocystales bacterium]